MLQGLRVNVSGLGFRVEVSGLGVRVMMFQVQG